MKYQSKVEAAWFDDTFSYRQTVAITNAGSAQTDFQVSITLNTSALITAGKMQSDCDDIRVTDVSGKVLPIWIETGTNACNTATTAIWTKVPNISTTGTTVFLYYGNGSVTNTQNGNNVFIYFDDFSGSSIDSLKWTQGTIGATTGTNFTISGGNLTGGNTNRYIRSISAYTGDYVAETRVYTTTSATNGYSTIGFYASPSNNFGILDHSGTSYYRNDAGWVNFSYNGTSQWNRDKVKVIGTSAAYWRIGETSGSSTNTATNSGISGEYLRLSPRYDDSATNQNYSASWDWVFIRKSVTTEPTVATPTNEEKSTGPVAYWKFDEGYGVTAQNSTWQKTGTTTNLEQNPSLETNMTGWGGWNNSGTATRELSTEKAAFGSYSFKQTVTATGNQEGDSYGANVQEGHTYTVSFWVNAPSVGSGESVPFYYRVFANETNYIIGTITSITAVTNGWTRYSMTQTIPVNGYTGTNIQLSFYTQVLGTVVYVDGVQIEESSSTTNYCDGFLTGNGSHALNGSPHNSSSICDVGTNGDISGSTWQSEDQCINRLVPK